MYKNKYLKYKKKYLELKNNMVGNGHGIWEFDEIKFLPFKDDYKKDDIIEEEGTMFDIKFTDYNIKHKSIGNITGRWKGRYISDDTYKGQYTEDGESWKETNEIGMWSDNNKTYYGIYNNNNVKNINVYEPKDGDNFTSRFIWYDIESYLKKIILNNNPNIIKIKKYLNENFETDKGWEISEGYGDGYCSIYAFFLGLAKISKESINFPKITINSKVGKKDKTKIFVENYIKPLFDKIIDCYKTKIVDVEIQITLNNTNSDVFYNRLKNMEDDDDDPNNKILTIFNNNENIDKIKEVINHAINKEQILSIGYSIFTPLKI